MSKTSKINYKIEAIDNYSIPAEKIAKSNKKLVDALSQGTKKLREFKGIDRKIGQFNKLAKASLKTHSELKKQKEITKQLSESYKKLKKPTGQQTREFKQAAAKSEKLREKYKKQIKTLKDLRAELRGSGLDTNNLKKEQVNLAQKMRDTNKVLEKNAEIHARKKQNSERFDKTLSRVAQAELVAGGAERAGRAALRMVQKPTRKAMDFESAMADVRKTVSFENKDGLKNLGLELRKLSKKEIPLKQNDLARIAAQGGQFGISEKNLTKFTKDAAKMAIAFDIDSAEAAESMAVMANINNIEISKITGLADAINYISDNTAAKAYKTLEVMTRIGSEARNFGLSPEQAAATGSSLLALGRQPERTSTALNSLFKRLSSPESQNKRFQIGLEKIGLDSQTLKEMTKNNAKETLDLFLNRIASFDGNDRSGLLVDLMGKDFSSIIGTLVSGLSTYNKAHDLVGNKQNYIGSMEREFQNRSKTSENRLILHQNRVADLQIRIGNTILPLMEKVLDFIDPIIESFSKFAESNKTLSSIVFGLTGGVGGLLLVASPVITALGSLAVSIAFLGKKARDANLNMAANAVNSGTNSVVSKKDSKKTQSFKDKFNSASKLKKAGIAGAAISGIAAISSLADENSIGEKAAGVLRLSGGMAGAMAGATAGAAAGTLILPVAGTAVGGLIGGVTGGFLGDSVGGGVGEWFKQKDIDESKLKNKARSFGNNSIFDKDRLVSKTDNSQKTINITVNQFPNEDSESFAKRILKEIEESNLINNNGVLYD